MCNECIISALIWKLTKLVGNRQRSIERGMLDKSNRQKAVNLDEKTAQDIIEMTWQQKQRWVGHTGKQER